MWRLTWRLLVTGVPLEFSIPIHLEQLKRQISKKHPRKVVFARKTKIRVAYSLKNNDLVVSRIRFNLGYIGSPAFYATIVEDDNSLQISGKFLFKKLVRIEFWLAVGATLAALSIVGTRLVNGYLLDKGTEFLIGAWLTFALVPLAAIAIAFLFYFFSRYTANDVAYIADDLKATLT